MNAEDLRALLELVEDTHEIVLTHPAGELPAGVDERHEVWGAAREEANAAYADWHVRPGADRYAVYRAAEDRADAAQAALTAAAARE